MAFIKKNKIILLFINIIFLISISIYFFSQSKIYKIKLTWDEVDYVNVAKKGIINNAFDLESQNIISFLKIGYNKVKKIDEFKIQNYSEINESSDNFLLRHYHPVLPVYFWSIFVSESIEHSDKSIKVSNLILFLFTFIFIMVFCNNYFKLDLYNKLLSFVVIYCFVTNTFLISHYFAINFHTYFSLICIFHIYAIINMYQNNFKKYSIFLFIFSISLLMITLETFPLVLIGTIISIFYLNKNSEKKLKFFILIKFFIISFALSIIFFPSLLIKGTILKIYFMYIYRIFTMLNAEYSNVGYLTNWINFIKSNYIFLLIPFISFVFFLLNQRKNNNNYALVPLIFAIVYSILMTPFMLTYTYILPVFLFLIYFSVFVLSEVNHKKNFIFNIFITLTSFLIILFNLYNLNIPDFKKTVTDYNLSIDDVVKIIDSESYINKKILIDGGHIFKYYAKNNNISNLKCPGRCSPSDPIFYVRNNYIDIDVTDKIKDGYYKLIIFYKERNFSKDKLNYVFNKGFKKLETNNYFIYLNTS